MPQNRREDRAVMYIRVATDRPDDTVARQREGCQRIAAKYGLDVVREYRDVAAPARLEQQRALQLLLRDVGYVQDIAYVVIWDYSRLAGDLTRLESILDWLQFCGVRVAAITGVAVVTRFAQAPDDPEQP
jgi:DNA invertase Pin-like site-specific DNA recombinase